MVRAGLEPGISGSQGKRSNHWATLPPSICFKSAPLKARLVSSAYILGCENTDNLQVINIKVKVLELFPGDTTFNLFWNRHKGDEFE